MYDTNKLLDVMSEIILTVHTDPYLKTLDNEQLMEWVKDQLNRCGFPVISMGACWLYINKTLS